LQGLDEANTSAVWSTSKYLLGTDLGTDSGGTRLLLLLLQTESIQGIVPWLVTRNKIKEGILTQQRQQSK